MTETPGTIAREFLREHRNRAALELDIESSAIAERIHAARQSPLASDRWNLSAMEAELGALTRARQVLRVVAEARRLAEKRRALPWRSGIELPAEAAAQLSASWRLELLALGGRIAELTALVNV